MTDNQKAQIDFDKLDVASTELAFVTSYDLGTRTFFAQLCKNSNQDLIDLNVTIGDYCEKALVDEEVKKRLLKVHTGSIVCSKFSLDGFWYRAVVLSRDKEKKTCKLWFVDYGNLEETSVDDVIVPPKSDLPCLEKDPFGIACFVEGVETYTPTVASQFLQCLNNTYIMLRNRGKMSNIQWKVDIPMHAYNVPFWMSFKPVVETKKDDHTTSPIKA